MKTLLILGASYSQLPLIEAAQKLGIRTVVASIPGDYPGFQAADGYVYANIVDADSVINAAREVKADGIATCCMDTGLYAQGTACTALGLTGPSHEAVTLCTNKSLMKAAFMEAGVQTAAYRKIHNEAELEQSMSELTFPLILKAVDQMGSRGIYRCNSVEEVRENYPKTMAATQKDYCLLEEFIEGILFGVEAMVKDGKPVFILPDGTSAFQGFTPTPVGHYVPAPELEGVTDQILEQVGKVITALGFDNCPMNCDFIRRGDKVYVVEATARAGATCLAELVGTYYDVNYYEQIVRLAMSLPLDEKLGGSGVHTPNLSHIIISQKAGIITALENRNPPAEDILDLSFNVEVGDEVRSYTNGRDRLGQIIIKGESLNACRERLSEVLKHITIEIAPLS